jgi:GPI-anchor transamidase subunit GAA1
MSQVMAPLAAGLAAALRYMPTYMTQGPTTNHAPVAGVLKVVNMCLASVVISATSLINFSLAATLAVLLGIPLSVSRPLGIRYGGLASVAYMLLALGWLWWPEEVSKAIWSWQVLGVWSAPFVCCVYAPLVLQASLVFVL